MTLDEQDEGDYRIYGGALEGLRGDGYIAALVVNQIRNTGRPPREVFRDDALACGHRWPSPEGALSYAMGKGREVVRQEQKRIAC